MQESALDIIRRGGRPSKADAEQLGETILDVATALFLAQGYGATSIETVAGCARISKRTFYHRFPDKAHLFAAVVHRIIQRLRPPAETELFTGGGIEEVLLRLALIMLHASIQPSTLALHRLMTSEAQRFPELAAAMDEDGTTTEAINGIAGLLEREVKTGRIAVDDTKFAAAQFMQLVIAIPLRRALGVGAPMTSDELDVWAKNSVELFLNGCRLKQQQS